jgi:hypothetical protein
LSVDLHQRQFTLSSDQMARTKNVGGGPGDDDQRPPPRQPVGAKGKSTKQVTSKKRKYPDVETARASAVAEATERAERGGAHSGVIIADLLALDAQGRLREIERLHGSPHGTVMMAGHRLAIEEPQPQGESQQESQQHPPPVEPQPAQETQEGQ